MASRLESLPNIPRWLRIVLICDRAGSSWYIGAGFFFAPVLAILSPWPALTTMLWVAIGVAGLWLGLLGVAMATGLAMVLRSNTEIPEDYWRSILDYPSAAGAAPSRPTPDSSRSEHLLSKRVGQPRLEATARPLAGAYQTAVQ